MARPPARFVGILGAVTALVPLSIDMYLPALPALQRELAGDPAAVQLTLGAFFVGLAVGQALYGPVTDRFGRKPPLYAGLAGYVLASAGCALAPGIGALVACRFVQALAGCAGLVVPRAMVRDRFDPQATARVFSRLLLVMGAAPILAPLAGGYVLAWLGWRAIFWGLAGMGLASLALAAVGLPETRPAAAQPAGVLGPALRGYTKLLTDRRYLGHALAGGLASAGMFAYISGSPFVLIQVYGVPAEAFGWVFGANALGLIAASQLNRRLLAAWRAGQVLARAMAATALMGVVLLLVALTGAGGLAGLLLPLFGFVASLGFTQPNALAGAMAEHPERAGSAAALYGTLQFLAATVAGGLVGHLHDGTAVPMAAVIAGCAVLALACHRTLVPSPPRGRGAG
jgi:DHA1 family bicyclomycin/chloramphenicol resistance-like MFS transporter